MNIAPVALREMQSAVLDWYAANGRELAFRRTTDAWAILVAEVIAQQTQAARAAEAWTRLIAQFPTPAALASVAPAVVIRAWRGLGYNRRAIALRTAAIRIVDEHGGRVPDSLDALESLPGIGPYTARAVLAFAFDRPVATLDTNVRRVLDRAVGPLPTSPRAMQAAADGFVPTDAAAAWGHALMDIGATQCVVRTPRCEACPIRATCRTSNGRPQASGATGERRRMRSKRPTQTFLSTTRWLRGRILDRLRDATDGMWVTFADPMGDHSPDAVRRELDQLATDGLLQLALGPEPRARLVTSLVAIR